VLTFRKLIQPWYTFRVYEKAGHDIQPVGSPYLMEGYREFMSKWIKEHAKINQL
jgi:hypothetical protein